MILHENPKLFEQAIRFTAHTLNLKEIFIEKDYWITFALKNIFESDFSENIVFKGGTSLSKCYKMINRFSEDIDLALISTAECTGNNIKRQLKRISKILDDCGLIEVYLEGISNKKGLIRKTAHLYRK
jgi:predicted nucleotidyltransferase component of viral defense system